MLSYQHAFHAGNHADILKHFVLSFVLTYLNKKDKPYTFFDTHSGSGLYDLLDNRSLKTGEAEKGVLSLFSKFTNSQNDFTFYFKLINKFLDSKMYPGSPLIEFNLLRNTDNLILSELHPQEIENLKLNINKSKNENSPNVQIHHRNGFEMLNALTPPSTKRGAVLIDPSYEDLSDYDDCIKYINLVNKKWSNGIIMLWYPLLTYRTEIIENMINTICVNARLINPKIEIDNLQLTVYSKDSHIECAFDVNKLDKKNPPRLYGSGMLVLNSPWKLKETTQDFISSVKSFLI